MVSEIIMYEAKCDGCKKQFELYDGVIALNEKSAVIDSIIDDDDWSYIPEMENCYCPNCHTKEWDEEGENLIARNNDGIYLGAVAL